MRRLLALLALLWVSTAHAAVVQTVMLLSTSGSTVAANTPSPPMFGLQFPACTVDATKCVASGQYPILQATDGTAWPATFINRASWSDGSIKHISVLPGPFPKSLPVVGGVPTPVTANVLNGGTAPPASGITTTQLYAEGCQVNANGFAGALGTGLSLQGNWAALLANDANNLEVVDLGDGGGGHVWRILTNVQNGGTAHGQMEVYWYVQGLVNATGGLAGWRLLPDLTQPWYDIDSPAKDWRGLQTFNIQCGATTVTPPFPYATADLPAANWISSTNNFTPTSTPNWETCGGDCIVPGYFTTTGTLPAGLSANTIYCGQQHIFATYVTIGGCDNTTPTITGAGTGTHTFHPIPLLLHFGHLIGATADGRYSYIQGAGTVAADAPIRITFDNAARKASRVFPPFDLTLSPAPTDNPSTYFGGATVAFDIMTSGPLLQDVLHVGDRDDIGVLNGWQARHFYNQTLIDEKYIRNVALVSGLFASNLRDRTTLGHINLAEANGSQSYSGLPASLSTTVNWGSQASPAQAGFTAPAHGLPQFYFTSNNYSHFPHLNGYAYLVTGEPQYLDWEKEQADQTIFGVSLSVRNPTYGGTTYYGSVMESGAYAFRQSAWAFRELMYASQLSPDGSVDKTYYGDLFAHSAAIPAKQLALQNSYMQGIGLWLQADGEIRQEYMMGYMDLVLSQAATFGENADAKGVLQNINALYYNHLYSLTGGAYPVVNYATYPYDTGIAGVGLPFFSCSLSWSSGTATITGSTNAITGMKINVSAGNVAYNGTFPVTVINPTTFTYPLASNPGGSSAGTCEPVGTDISDDAHLVLDFLMEFGPGDGIGQAFWTHWSSGTPGTVSKTYWDYTPTNGPGGAEWNTADGDSIVFPVFNSVFNNEAPPGGLSYAVPYYWVNTHSGSITSASYSGGTITVTTASPHGLTGTHNISLNGTNPAGYEWAYDCTVTDTTHFTCPSSLGDPGGTTTVGTYNTANLSLTKGGAALAITDTRQINDNFKSGQMPASPPPNWIGTDFVNDPGAYPALFNGGFNYMTAIGVTGISTLTSDTNRRFGDLISYFGFSTPGAFYNSGSTPTPKWAMDSSFGNPVPPPSGRFMR